MSGEPSTVVMTMPVRFSCLAARSAPMADGSLMVKMGIDLIVRGQERGGDVEAAFARADAVLVVGQDLDVRMSGHHLLAAVDAVDHAGDRRPVDDDQVALATELVGDVLAGLLAGGDVVGGDGRLRVVGGVVDGDHRNARPPAPA